MQKIQFDSSVCANDCMFVHSAFDTVAAGDAVVIGAGRSTKFKLTERALLLMPFDSDTYFQKEVDDRDIHGEYNFELISDLLPKMTRYA